MRSATSKLLNNSQKEGFLVWSLKLPTVLENVHNCCLNGEKVLVFSFGTVAPHELRQLEQIFNIVARVAAADGNLGGDLCGRGRAEIDGVVRGGDVDEGQQRAVTPLFRDELHHLFHVTPQHNLPPV